jgi:hypothetical protein
VLQVDGRGRYLLPGLADMHVHLHDRLHGLLYLANGVTSVRNMWGFPTHLEAIDQVERGDLLAPTICTVGPLMDGSPAYWVGSTVVNSAAEAEESVEAQHAAGFRSLNVFDNLTRDAYGGIVAAARRLDMRVVGHVHRSAGLPGALSDGQRSIEHLRGYLEELGMGVANANSFAERTRVANTWNCPTLAMPYLWAAGYTPAVRLAQPDLRYLARADVRQWSTGTPYIPPVSSSTPPDRRAGAPRRGRTAAPEHRRSQPMGHARLCNSRGAQPPR